MRATLTLAADMKTSYPNCTSEVLLYRPLPGTEDGKWAEERGYIMPEAFDTWGAMVEYKFGNKTFEMLPEHIKRDYRRYTYLVPWFDGLVKGGSLYHNFLRKMAGLRLRKNWYGQQQHRRRLGMTQDRGREQAGARFGDQAQIDERQNETRVRRGVDQVAMQEHGGADADRQTLHRRHQRLVESGDRLNEIKGCRPSFRTGPEIRQVISRAKGIPPSRDQHRANRFARRRIRQRGYHGVIHGACQSVFLVRAIEMDLHHALIFHDRYILAHARPLPCCAAKGNCWRSLTGASIPCVSIKWCQM